MLTIETVQTAFQPFENGDPPSFFKNYVADDVVWTITGSDTLSGKYTSKREVLDKTLNPVVRHMATPYVSRILLVV
jgi:ketosteroid isomerase-like protein